MSDSASLRQVIVVPRNGYANRLQAWASAAILAARLETRLRVLWEPEPIAPAEATDLFSASAVSDDFIDPETFVREVGRPHDELPRYLSSLPGIISLAGHDRGEQVFMRELADLMRTTTARTLVIIAGGKYRLPGPGDFLRERRDFYAALSWSDVLDARVAQALECRDPFVALHIRQTDRSREAPPARVIRSHLVRLGESQPQRSLFIAADTAEGRARWAREATALGFAPWSVADVDHDRAHVAAGIDALTDWRLLAASEALVYPATSTFSEEASVASGHHDRAFALMASPARRNLRALGRLASTAATFPARRLRNHRA